MLQNATNQTFDKKKHRSQDWFEDHDEKIQSHLKDKKLSGDRTALRKEIRKLKNRWFQQKADEAEKFAKENNLREFYVTINAVYGPKPRNLYSVRAKTGSLLSSPKNIKKRWVEHFEKLLTNPQMPIGVYLINLNSGQLLKSSMSQSNWKRSRLLSKTPSLRKVSVWMVYYPKYSFMVDAL